MTHIEDDLRATFARHDEALAPDVAQVRARINLAWVRAKRRRLVRRITGAAAVVLLAGAAVPAVLERLPQRTPPVPVAEQPAPEPAPAGPIDVLLVGSDNRLRWDDPQNRRADTVMMIHVPADRSRTYLISLSRDGEVKLAGGKKAKLAETLYIGGPALTEQTVSALTGVDFDARVTLDLRALRAVTAAAGGVEMCLPEAIKVSPTGQQFPKGCQHVGAGDVSPLLQARYGLKHGGYDRERNTQRFLRALAAKLTGNGTLTDPARMQALLQAGRDGIEVTGDVGALLAGAASLGSAEVVGVSWGTFAGNAEGREQIYPRVGEQLYAAIRADTLEAWTTANPKLVTK
jgi:LCP family protein required for cell wall assembly